MRLLASLLLAVALAAPFGDAGAFSLAAAGACPGDGVARVEGLAGPAADGIGSGGIPSARRYLPPSMAASSGEGLGGGEAPSRSGGAVRPEDGEAGLTARAPAAATPRTSLPAGGTAFLRAFPAHPSTAPPLRA